MDGSSMLKSIKAGGAKFHHASGFSSLPSPRRCRKYPRLLYTTTTKWQAVQEVQAAVSSQNL